MSKTFKTCTIFSISTVWFVLMRMVFSYVNIGDYPSSWVFSFLVQVVGMGIIPLLLCRFWVKEDPFTAFCFKRRLKPIVYVLTVVLGVVVSFLLSSVSAVWQTVLRMIGYTQTNSAGTVYPYTGGIWILAMEIITSAIFPGIFEEINYRGLGAQMFSDVEDDRIKIIFIGALFGLGHQFIAQTGYAFVAGVILAFLLVKTRSIIPGMIIHFMNNFIAVFADYSSQTGGTFAAVRESILSVFFKNFFLLFLFIAMQTALTLLLLRLIRKYSQAEDKEIPDGKEEFYYPNKKQYVDDIFGDLEAVREPEKDGSKWYEYAPLYGAAAIMIVTTIFTFVWGVGR